MIESIQGLALAHAPDAVSTVGQLEVLPNSRNTIPGEVRFTVDLRHADASVLETIVDEQASVANILVQPLGLFIFFTAGLAELGRTPFDIHHAESEVVGGPFVEYSGAHWAVFFLAEYMNTFTIAALTVLLFLGGWRWPDMPFEGVAHSSLSAVCARLFRII